MSLICVGQIVASQGLKGTVKIKPRLVDPMGLARLAPMTDKTGTRAFSLHILSRKGENVLAAVAGITDRDQADALRGTELYVPRESLTPPAPHEFYHADLVGLAVLRDGQKWGEVVGVQNYGAGDILEVRGKDGRVIAFGFSKETFPQINLEAKTIALVVPEGMREVIHES